MPFTPDGNSLDSLQTPARSKCATVTMMLAERIARSDWSVDDEHFFETNTMNVWQTLEYLSNINLRRRYHYEGYNDTENIIRTLTPSWRRDSFAEKNANEEVQQTSGKYANSTTHGIGNSNAGRRPASSDTTIQPGKHDEYYTEPLVNTDAAFSSPHRRGRRRSRSAPNLKGRTHKRKHAKGRKSTEVIELDPEYALLASEYTDLVKCNKLLRAVYIEIVRPEGNEKDHKSYQ